MLLEEKKKWEKGKNIEVGEYSLFGFLKANDVNKGKMKMIQEIFDE
jgi:hypothetical protein